MDKDLIEIMEAASKLKADNKILQGLIDYVLDESRLDYTGEELRLDDTDGILLFVKVFFTDEYDNRVRYLQKKAAEDEKKAADQLEEA